jgi:serine/threonine protein kinase/ketosteroid isomerase-like protein
LILDKYRIDKLLARGGMGAIYAGTHVELDRPVAIKLLLPSFNADGQVLERFRREARAAARVKHPNIVDIYDYGVLADSEAYIIMELAEGETLHEHLKRVGKLPINGAIAIARQIAEGMDAAHRTGIVHRDLKPSNIILTREPDGGLRAKIVDFGIAKITEQLGAGDATLTATGTLVGTPRYMSPEQCSDGPVDARSDIYSLGIILYEMLAGRTPFEGDTPVALAVKRINEPPPPIAEQRSDVPPPLAELVTDMLSTDPAKRPQTARELAQRLAQLRASNGAYAARAAHAQPVANVSEPTAPLTFTKPETRASARPGGPIVVNIPEETQVRHRQPSLVYAALALAAVAAIIAIWSATQRPHSAQTVQVAQMTTPTPLTTITPAAHQSRPSPTASVKATASPKAENTPQEKQEGKTKDQAAKEKPADEVDAASQEAADVPPQTRAEISGALGEWMAATNSGDVAKQMTLYNPQLGAFYKKRDVTRADVQAEKQRLFDQASKIDVRASEPQITISRDGRTATTRFRKRYNIEGKENREGEVLQELRWVKTEHGWKIISERDLKVIR